MRWLVTTAFPTTQTKRNRMIAGAGVLLTCYFLLHTISGDRGLLAEQQLNHKISVAEARLADLHAQQDTLAKSVAGLEPGHLDHDQVEAQAYKTLGFAAPQDQIILFGNEGQDLANQGKNP